MLHQSQRLLRPALPLTLLLAMSTQTAQAPWHCHYPVCALYLASPDTATTHTQGDSTQLGTYLNRQKKMFWLLLAWYIFQLLQVLLNHSTPCIHYMSYLVKNNNLKKCHYLNLYADKHYSGDWLYIYKTAIYQLLQIPCHPITNLRLVTRNIRNCPISKPNISPC